ncbi:hypothetical protein DFAR_850033 [Desulfarculales bacterium]
MGIVKILFSDMVEKLKKVSAATISIFVKRLDWRLLKFFESIGFQQDNMTNLELNL